MGGGVRVGVGLGGGVGGGGGGGGGGCPNKQCAVWESVCQYGLAGSRLGPA